MNISILPAIVLASALSLGGLGAAKAAEYTSLDTEASSLSFGYSQMSVNMDGAFTEMKAADFSFDPDQPEAARLAIEIALASADAGYEEANAELEKPEWLNLAAHPLATFRSTQVRALENGRYQVTGDLSIKGNTKEVTAPFTFRREGGQGVFEGSFIFQRADFGIGEGQWEDFSIVANDIRIDFRFVANS